MQHRTRRTFSVWALAGALAVARLTPAALAVDADQVVVEHFSHVGQALGTYPKGTRWYVWQPAGADPAGKGAWIRHELSVPAAALAAASAVTTYPCIKGSLRGHVYKGARIWVQDADNWGTSGVSADAAGLTVSQGQFGAGDALTISVPAGLSAAGGTMMARVWLYNASGDRDSCKIEQLDAGSSVVDTDTVDSDPAGASDGVFASAWIGLQTTCVKVRLSRNNDPGSTGEFRGGNLDLIDTAVSAAPGDTITVNGQTRCGALLLDGSDGTAVMVQAVNGINDTVATLPAVEMAVYWDTDGTYDGDPAGAAKSFGGYGHGGISGGTLVIETQDAAGAWSAWTPSRIGDADAVDAVRIGIDVGDVYLYGNRTGGVQGSLWARYTFDAEGYHVHNRVTVTAAGGMYVFRHYITDGPLPPQSCTRVRFGSEGWAELPGSGTPHATRKTHSCVLDGDAANQLYYHILAGPFGQRTETALEYMSLNPVSDSGGNYYKCYTLAQIDTANPTFYANGAVIENRYALRVCDRSVAGIGMNITQARLQGGQ